MGKAGKQESWNVRCGEYRSSLAGAKLEFRGQVRSQSGHWERGGRREEGGEVRGKILDFRSDDGGEAGASRASAFPKGHWERGGRGERGDWTWIAGGFFGDVQSGGCGFLRLGIFMGT
jgi:hypothetical protein